MDDLSSVEWSASKQASVSAGSQHPYASGNYYPALRPTPPISGRSTPSAFQPPLQKPSNNIPTRSSSSTPANDTFANLVSFNATQSTKGLSLQEQQQRLQEEKTRQESEKQRAFDAQFGSSQGSHSLPNGSNTHNPTAFPPAYSATSEYGGHKLSKTINKPFANIPAVSIERTATAPVEDESDLLAAFNAAAPVDRSSHMPDTSRSTSIDHDQGTGITRNGLEPLQQDLSGSQGGYNEDLDDDPFGLGTAPGKTSVTTAPVANGASADDEDVLGLLGRPVAEFARKPDPQPAKTQPTVQVVTLPQDRAVAELVDMGFSTEKSRRALESTESGVDVQAAVGWLLNQAHEESRKKDRLKRREEDHNGSAKTPQSARPPGRRKSSSSETAKPAWMRDSGRLDTNQGRANSRSPVNGEKDPAQYASEFGSKMFKSAGSLWKTGTKKLNQAVQEFNSDSDSSQPKWMRNVQAESENQKTRPPHRESDVQDHDRMESKSHRPAVVKPTIPDVTDEALMLEADSRPPRKSRATPSPLPDRADHPRERATPSNLKPREELPQQPKFMQQVPKRDAKAKLSRQAVEEETSQAYISPARRKRTTPKPAPQPKSGPDLLFESSKPSITSTSSHPTPSPQPRPIQTPSNPVRATPQRNVPPISSFALQASSKGRQEGNAAFKRGDYAQATTSYSSSLSAIPNTHPLAIVILTNRALSHSKTGDPKASLADAKSALDLIGPSKGTNETIDLGSDEGSKQMNTYWGKAMLRQAEALEHLERWSDAATIWRTCVEAGVGGATSSAGRARCEKAAAPPPAPAPTTKPSSSSSSAPNKKPSTTRPKPTPLNDLALAPDSESVTRLRAANLAASRLDDEKFALADTVDARVSRWRAGKEGNLRALLSTLENVLWEGAGWKKVGMGDVLMPGRVKVVYMRGIGRVHPDKIPTMATTEQRMISAAVFATLNEAWERFKAENRM